MIIQCEKCGTKYRFDESLIAGEGVWVRCSRCKNEFFQENPSKEEVSPPEMTEGQEAVSAEAEEGAAEQEIEKEIEEEEAPSPDVTEEKEAVSAEAEEEAAGQEVEEEIEEEEALPPDVTEEKEAVSAEAEEEVAEQEIEKEVEEEEALLPDVPEEEEAVSVEAEEEVAEQEVEKEIEEEEAPPLDVPEEREAISAEAGEGVAEQEIEKEVPSLDELAEGAESEDEETAEKDDEDRGIRKGKRLWTPGKVVAYTLIVILVLGGVYLWLFPQMREQVLNKISSYISTDKLKESFGTSKESVKEKVKGVDFIDVKERFVKNWIFGNVLVIHGIVVNRCDYPISQVKVRGKLLDPSGKVLDEIESYCGNLLTDEELGNLTKKEITGELSIPAGSDVSNDSIASEGNIPFMIVFPNPSKEAEEFIVELARDARPSK